LIDSEIKKQVSNVDGQRAENERAVPCVPEPTVTGNDKIEILKHEFYFSDPYRTGGMKNQAVWISIKNVSKSTIASAFFEVTFYWDDGSVASVIEHKEVELKAGASRSLIVHSGFIYETIKSYVAKVVKTTTVEAEKGQIKRFDINSD
jgi:hypothetical protein